MPFSSTMYIKAVPGLKDGTTVKGYTYSNNGLISFKVTNADNKYLKEFDAVKPYGRYATSGSDDATSTTYECCSFYAGNIYNPEMAQVCLTTDQPITGNASWCLAAREQAPYNANDVVRISYKPRAVK